MNKKPEDILVVHTRFKHKVKCGLVVGGYCEHLRTEYSNTDKAMDREPTLWRCDLFDKRLTFSSCSHQYPDKCEDCMNAELFN